MCFSATVSYSAAAVLVPTGLYAVKQARQLQAPYWMWGLVPLFFGLQQACEGRVWQMLDAGDAHAAVPYAIGFHLFSHWLWLWWFGLGSYVVEPGKIRRRIMGGCTLFGAFAGTVVFAVMLSHPEWMTVAVREHSIAYKFSVPYRDSIHLPITPAALYALTTLVPLFGSSNKRIIIFGGLVALSSLLTSEIYAYAYISVWCLFAAGLSLYLVYMIKHLVVQADSTALANRQGDHPASQ
ncbi:DUF6629 family protein [Sideroxydans lithotrophicus]|uniref:Uncharacterized protein n=1 Tax=Sideroxydans lithotrophicus (strain ES-1) TaxID=580332 RepID=D5CR75_SIDLE|nr:DUF6629 family protein [Sideroxydans lithotrophicus]ADE11461.1 conserved hypothetical protein [Sideroxydans lithotrophicus ES-1]